MMANTKIIRQVWFVILKMRKSIRGGLSMLWPDKSFSSRLVFGMAFLCTLIFVINALFTIVYSCGLIVTELGLRADKEFKVAKMICDREQQRSDTTSTERLFHMIMETGIDSSYVICITDSTNKILACNRQQFINETINLKNNNSDIGLSFDSGGVDSHMFFFNNAFHIYLEGNIVGTPYSIVLINPLNEAFKSVIDVVKKVGLSSWWLFCALVVCYLVMLYMLRRASSKNKQIEGELDVASQIQKQMVPHDFSVFPESHGYNLHGMLQPAKTMGGDLLDYVLRDNELIFCIGDVSGKSMPAALFMSEVHVLFHHVLLNTTKPEEICSAMNRSLADGNDTNMFCTFFVGVIDFGTNTLNYCNAGHNKPVVIDSNGQAQFLQVVPNIALGIIDDFQFQAQQMTLEPGTTLVTYTDGVTEAESLNHHLLGDETLLSTIISSPIEEHRDFSPQEIIRLVMKKIKEHTLLAEQSDDITMLVVKKVL